MANHVNPILIAIPCHRVIQSSGEPGGYAEGEEIKRTLLSLEGAMTEGRQIATYGSDDFDRRQR